MLNQEFFNYFFIGLLTVFVFVAAYARRNVDKTKIKLKSQGTRTMATVVHRYITTDTDNHSDDSMRIDHDNLNVFVNILDSEGKTHEARLGGDNDYQKGEELEVVYLKDNIKRVYPMSYLK